MEKYHTDLFPPFRLTSNQVRQCAENEHYDPYYSIEKTGYIYYEDLIEEAAQYELLCNPDDWF